MKFTSPLISGTLIKRYKRFMADITLDTGELVTAHCANPGAMLGLKESGMKVWLSKSDNPKRKLKYSWELVELKMARKKVMVGINTGHPNKLVEEAIQNDTITELKGYDNLRREVKYGVNSRIDILLESSTKPHCYVEVKNVHLLRDKGLAEFPDSVTTRGTKHLNELSEMVKQGHRAMMVYLIQRNDASNFTLARDIDKKYGEAFDLAHKNGVEVIAYDCVLSKTKIEVNKPIKIVY